MTQTALLGDICTKVTSGGTPSTKHDEYYNGDIPWLRTQEVNFGNIYSTEKTITEAGLKNSSAKLIPENSVIIAMYGATAGKSAINKIPLTTNQACCNLIIDHSKADYRYVYYCLLNDYEKLANSAVGAAQQNLGAKQIASMSIELPDLETQKKIANVLGTIDEKIELNRKMNETLEQMGQTLFRHYFIDNPEAERWGNATVGEFAKHLKTPINPAKSPAVIFNQYSIPAYDNSFTTELSAGDTIKSGKYQVEPMSILVSKLNPATPRVWCVLEPKENAVCSTEFQVIVPNDYFAFCYFLLTSKAYSEKMTMSAGGTSNSHRRIKPSDILSYSFTEPNADLLESFEDEAMPVIKMIERNREQIQTLTTLRDTLLPRLINGKLEV